MGTRYTLVAVELADDETPVQHEEQTTTKPQETAPGTPSKDEEKTTRPWSELKPSNQAGIVCSEPAFTAFLKEEFGALFRGCNNDAAAFTRQYCGVKSRSQIADSEHGSKKWNRLQSLYRMWQDAPAHGV